MPGGWFSLLVALALAGCQAHTPKQVSERYLDAFHDRDYEKAKKYGTAETGKLLDMFIGFAALMPDSAKHSPRFKVLDEKQEGDTAYVHYTMEGSRKVQTLTLIKVDGEWKVAASKDSLNEIEGGEGMDSGATQTDTTQGPGSEE